jgi:hypothetical protein
LTLSMLLPEAADGKRSGGINDYRFENGALSLAGNG